MTPYLMFSWRCMTPRRMRPMSGCLADQVCLGCDLSLDDRNRKAPATGVRDTVRLDHLVAARRNDRAELLSSQRGEVLDNRVGASQRVRAAVEFLMVMDRDADVEHIGALLL